MDEYTLESVTCWKCKHTWVSSHPYGSLTVTCPRCEEETLTLSDPDTIAELERQKRKKT